MADTSIKILADREDIVAIADAVRNKTGTSGEMTLGGIASGINGIEVQTDPVLQSKTVTPTTSSQNVTPDSGYDGLSQVTVNAMPTATQATPSITVSSSGLITASATQTAGYVAAGTKSATKQLTTQGAKTITPSTSSQTAVASGVYTTGAVTVGAIPSSYVKPTTTKAAATYTPSTSNQTIAAGTYCSGTQTIKGDANLVASNIVSGKSIFGVVGTAAVNGWTYDNSYISSVYQSAFYRCSNLTGINLTSCRNVGQSAFYKCETLEAINLPNCTYIASYAFVGCDNLVSVNLPNCMSIDYRAFSNCQNLETVYLPVCSSFNSQTFKKCYILKSVYLGATSKVTVYENPFQGCSLMSTKGSIFVPASLISAYKSAKYWSAYSSRFFAYSFT